MIPLLMLSLEVVSLSLVKDWPPVALRLELLRESLSNSGGEGISKFEIKQLRLWAKTVRNGQKNVFKFLNVIVAASERENDYSGAYSAANAALWAILDGYDIPDWVNSVLSREWRDMYGFECPYNFTPKGFK